MKTVILDCTLRDGGYYNNWDFNPEVVNAYLNSVAEAKIDFVELGLRNFSKKGFLGAYAYTTEEHLNSLKLPEGPRYGVMVDAKTIITSGLAIEDAIASLFVPADQSKISLVRVAAHFKEVEKCGPIARKLKSLGYTVGFNLMQAGGKSAEVISQKVQTIATWDSIDVLYFADSLGNMDSLEVERIVTTIRADWHGPIGIHTHNNMAKGLDNTLTAKSLGVSWLDSTVTGMGRGAGNTPTECLLAVLVNEDHLYEPKPIYDLVVRHFESMQRQYGWGTNLLYFLGAQNRVHPTYIQNLLADTHYGPDEIIGAIDYLSKLDGTETYKEDILDTAFNIKSMAKKVSGSDYLVNKFENRELLIVNNGPSLSKYLKPIETYIETRKPIVLAVNMIDILEECFIDYFCVSHNTKFLSEHEKYSGTPKPIILPKHRFGDDEVDLLPENHIDFGLSVEKGKFEVSEKYCKLPFDLTFAYAIAIAVVAGAKKISLVGVDGYEANDLRQLEMIKLIERMDKVLTEKSVVALTPTSYPIYQGSIYAPA